MIKKYQSASIFLCIGVVLGCSATSNNATSSKLASAATADAQYNTATISPPSSASSEYVASSASGVKLSMEQIMSDPDWIGRQPQSAFFSPTGDSLLYYRKRQGSVVRDLFETNEGQGNGEQVSLSALHERQYDEIIDDNDYNFIAWIYSGNVFVQNRDGKDVVQLTKDSDTAQNLSYFGSNGVAFRKGNGFHSINVQTGLSAQVLEWKFADNEPAVSAPADYIAQEQQKLIQYIQVERKNKQDRRARQDRLEKENKSLMANTFYFDKSHRLVLASLSPNGKYAIVVTREDISSRGDSDIMPDYIEEDGRIKAHSVRARVADAKPQSHSIYFLDLNNNTQKKLGYQGLPGYNEDVLAQVKRENAEARGETYTNNRLPRDIGLLFNWYASEMPIKWHDSGSHVALMLEAWDNKDRWIVTVDVNKPVFTTQHRMHDTAWVNYRFNKFGWFDQTAKLYFLSEESGYSQLYTKALNGKLTSLTKGRFVVDDVVLSKDDSYFYYKANKKHPGIYEIYRIKADGGEPQALTNLNGMTDFVLSPAQDRLLLTHSSLAMPPELYVMSVDSAGVSTKLTNTVSDEFLSIDWAIPSIVAIQSSHTEQAIYSRVYTPTNMSENSKQRAVVFNHGAGYLQNAHLGWSGYFREFMFHSLLVSQGYVVLDMDYRASAGYGREWRTAIYRQMGTPEVQDLKDGVKWLVENANVDEKRIGTYGGSYGGFLTFMALFKEPDLFQAGAALRPVSDWAHYNFPYTANILNTPDIDPIAYEKSSPIYFAEGLSKPLLMNAPMVDDNVFFVDVVRLVQRLIELEKENFETAIYPVEPHGFVQPSSWLDEYRRIHKLFETHL
jgi:dipeptidyl aminopeptidase/acylaminoacyl peptidase